MVWYAAAAWHYPENDNPISLQGYTIQSSNTTMDALANTVGIIGAGPAGLITAHVLLQDGFDVQLLTEDRTPGGVWARHRVYPSMRLNKCVPHAASFICPSFSK